MYICTQIHLLILWCLKQGKDGIDGFDGIPGAPGEKGNRGISGHDGRKGHPGIPGRPGRPGLLGPIGPKGIDGMDGDPGEMGWPGNFYKLKKKNLFNFHDKVSFTSNWFMIIIYFYEWIIYWKIFKLLKYNKKFKPFVVDF